MYDPIDLSGKRPSYREEVIEGMDDQRLRAAQRNPGAFGADTKRIQRELDDEIDRRFRDQQFSPTDEFSQDAFALDDSLDQSFETDIVEPVEETSFETIEPFLYDVDFDEESLNFDPEAFLEEGVQETEAAREDSETSSDQEGDASQSGSSGGGAITMGVIGGAVGSVGGPAGAAAGAAVGGLLGSLFD